jgi:hypothetical protein
MRSMNFLLKRALKSKTLLKSQAKNIRNNLKVIAKDKPAYIAVENHVIFVQILYGTAPSYCWDDRYQIACLYNHITTKVNDKIFIGYNFVIDTTEFIACCYVSRLAGKDVRVEYSSTFCGMEQYKRGYIRRKNHAR